MANGTVTTGVDVSGTGVSEGGLDLANILPVVLEKFVQVLEASAIVIGSIFLIRFMRKKLQKIETDHAEQRTALNLLEKITTGFIIVIALTLALKTVGIDMTLLVSVAVLGLSYGLQDIIKNYVAGILILFKAPFKIGEIVKIRDFTGKVSRMDFQATTLETFDNRHITIYNSDVMTQSIVNYSNNAQRRLELDVTLGYGSDVPKALQIFQKILSSDANVLKQPKFSVVFKKFTDLGPTFTLKFWVQRPCNILKIRTAIAALITQTFDEESIFAPYVKGVEAEDETLLNKVSDVRKKRSQDFYAQPLFAAAAAEEGAAPAVGPDGTPLPAPLPDPDFDEPEA
ncbi:MAG TPA: mechanosensitive ion channel domain-containing protein [Candidatus Gracilibacteria bacterium]|nr:mechanosensitive ion channel domain-containing protein [Candidatus Gracilibacteria bacterium]